MGRVKEQLGELRDLEEDELASKLREAKEELFNLRFQSATGQLESHGRLKAVRRDIARIYTVLRERELGIGAYPGDDGVGVPAQADTDSAAAEQAEGASA